MLPDYEYLGFCEYGVPAFNENMVEECEEAAVARVWWEDSEDSMLVCAKHLKKALEVDDIR